MSTHLILVEQERDWRSTFPRVNVVSARDYLMQPEQYKSRGTRIINLCRGYRYLSTGYYCSLLGEARHHRVIPSVHTITDLSRKSIYSLSVEDLDDLVQRLLRKRAIDASRDSVELDIFFGRSEDVELKELARQLFDLMPVPLLRVEFRRRPQWQIASLRPLSPTQVKAAQVPFFNESLEAWLSRRWRSPRTPRQSRYDIAILHSPEERLPPSNQVALKRFIEAGRKVGADVELITRKDYGRLAEYDALFIRETTAIDHHTYQFAKKAESEGMVVIDDPTSIVKCTNKVFLAELLARQKVPAPRCRILRKGEDYDLAAAVGYPAVLKIPDGSFSRGVFKAENPDQAGEITARLFRESDLILAQEFLYTDFDWRVGILNHEILYVCQYLMSKAHWQIVKYAPDGKPTEGGFRRVAIEETPPGVLKAARDAARLIGDGLYGVDVKERDGQVYVIEVNDNPSIDSGVEDGGNASELYVRIMADFVRRLDQRRGIG